MYNSIVMKALFPAITPYKTHLLKVSSIHTLYIEESGNPKGKPIISFHGGPGSQSKPDHRCFYDPSIYRIILFDQRGCGKSTPLGETRENTTRHLVDDIEKIREYLSIDRWVVNGGSWGSTLALAYAQSYPHRPKALILRGIFTFRKWEIEWFTQNARAFFPDKWDRAMVSIPRLDKQLNDYLYEVYAGPRTPLQIETITSLNIWHRSLMKLIPDEPNEGMLSPDAVAGERILYYYIKNKGFLKEGQLIENAHLLKDIPAVIIQGRYDMCCPPVTAWELYKKMPHAHFHMIPDAGHKSDEQGTMEKIIEYAKIYSTL